MGCRQSKAPTESPPQENSTFSWLVALGLQQHYAAFYSSGYGNVHSLVGLTRNHLNVIAQACPEGLPEEHKQAILAAAQQLSVDHPQTVGAKTTAAPTHCQSSSTFPQPDGIPRSEQQQQVRLPNGTQRLASHALDSSISSYTSFTSDSGSDSTLGASHGSTGQSGIAATARQASRPAPSRAAAAPDRPAPSQSQLQVLYSQMEADYKRLQDRPAHSRGPSHPPLHADAPSNTSGSTAVAASNRQGSRQPAAVAASPATKGKSAAQPVCIQVAAGVPASAAGLQHAQAPAPGKAKGLNQHSHLVGGGVSPVARLDQGYLAGGRGGLSGAGDDVGAVGQIKGTKGGGVQRVSAAAAVKQMRKQKAALPAEPFVQVFTNFQTLSKDAGVVEAMPGGQQQQHHHDMPSQLIAAQYMPEPGHQQQVQQPLPPTEARQFQFPSRLPKPPPVVPPSQVKVTQPVNSSGIASHGQLSDRQVSSQQRLHVSPAASSGMSNDCDQYEALRLQSSLIPRHSQSSLTVPSQSQMLPVPYQAEAQPQLVQSVTHKSAFAASAISYQTPQAVSAAHSASQRDSITVQQSAGPAMTASRHQERQNSMHHQRNAGGGVHGNDAMKGQGQSTRAEQEQPFCRQQPTMMDRQAPGPYGTQGQGQGQGCMPEQQQPYSVAAGHQQGFTEHTISRSPDGSSTTESRTVASSSSHYESSFRRGIPTSALPRPGVASGAGSTAAEALRVIRAAKLHRHGPAPQSPALAPAPALLNRKQERDRSERVRQQMMYMDAQIRQRVQQLQQRL